MGLIRKSLAVSTLGVVSGSSKKQRTAKATMRATQSIETMLRTATADAVEVAQATPPPADGSPHWSQAHADAIMAAHRRGDRPGVQSAMVDAYASIGLEAPAV